MARFKFHIGINLRCYGNVEVEAESIEAALPMLTADFIGEHIDIHETTTDSGEQIALIDVSDAETDETLGDWWAGHSLPSPYDPRPDADLLAALKGLLADYEGWSDSALAARIGMDRMQNVRKARAAIAGASPSTRRDGPVLREGVAS